MAQLPTQINCPGCSARVKPHASTNRIPDHPERNEKRAPKCRFSGDYPPGFVPETSIRRPRRAEVA